MCRSQSPPLKPSVVAEIFFHNRLKSLLDLQLEAGCVRLVLVLVALACGMHRPSFVMRAPMIFLVAESLLEWFTILGRNVLPGPSLVTILFLFLLVFVLLAFLVLLLVTGTLVLGSKFLNHVLVLGFEVLDFRGEGKDLFLFGRRLRP